MTATPPPRIAYFDCASGVSGDMILGALVDAGLSLADLQTDIDRLEIGAGLRADRVDRCGVGATHVRVDIAGQPMTPSREQHLQTGGADPAGREPGLEHEHATHEHEHGHDHGGHEHEHTAHEHDHGHDAHAGPGQGGHGHTRLGDIVALIEASVLDTEVQATATRVFRRLTEAEAEVHGADVDDVGLHEVGSLDAVVDIVGAVAGLRRLGVTEVRSSALHVGTGTVQCAHGRYPVPVPGVVALCRGVPLVQTEIAAELVTPTGAALLTTLASAFGAAPAMTLQATGYGAGGRDLATTPNVVRLRLGAPLSAAGAEPGVRCVLLETNVDDMSPEVFGYLFERLLAAGARDVYITPVLMKKNRPGHLLSVLVDPDDVDTVADIVLAETTSLGVRYHEVTRRMLPRSGTHVETPYGQVRLKVAYLPDRRRVAPEYDDCAELARRHGVPIQTVYAAAIAAADKEGTR